MPIGAHVKTSGGLAGAVDRACEIGAECVQVFLCAPQQWREPRHADDEIERFTGACRGRLIGPNFAHAIYLINLASADPSLHARSVAALRAGAAWAERCGLDGIIVHVGSAKGQPVEDAEARVVDGLRQVLEAGGSTRVLLENSAGAGDTLGARFTQLGGLLRRLDGHPRLGVCLDTAHAFASGYDLRQADGLEGMLEEVERSVGLDRLRAIHANDSRTPLGGASDRHENIGRGHVGEDAFARMLAHPALAALPWLLEVPGYAGQGPDRENVEALKRLAGRPV